jgi:hypothetical protein
LNNTVALLSPSADEVSVAVSTRSLDPLANSLYVVDAQAVDVPSVAAAMAAISKRLLFINLAMNLYIDSLPSPNQSFTAF